MARPGEEGKLDASGTSHSGNANVAGICNQMLMMLSHEIFDPEFGKRVLIDQAFIVAGESPVDAQARSMRTEQPGSARLSW